MNEKDNFALVPRAAGLLEKAEPGAKRILSGMVADTLALAKKTASKEVRVADAQLESWYQEGEKYYRAIGVRHNYIEAVKWFRKAAEGGHAKAQYKYGICLYNGAGTKQDCREAEKWYRKAANQGLAQAQGTLDLCYPQFHLRRE
jgi:TPR repeat protein